MTVRAPQSWKDPHTHFMVALEHPWYRIVTQLQSAVTGYTMDFWRARDVINLHLPLTTGSVSSPFGLGSDSLPVSVQMFGVETYLADSMQFMLEFGCRLHDEGCYYVMPSFRGEDPDESHLCQFVHSEAELPGTLDDVIAVVESYIVHLCGSLLDGCSESLATAGSDMGRVEKVAGLGPFPRMTFDDAVRRLEGVTDAVAPVAPGIQTITRRGEMHLMETVGEPLWITHWDHRVVPFYQAFAEDDSQRALCADLLLGAGELVGAGERHFDGDDVRAALAIHGVSPSTYEWYIEMKDRYPRKTSGFGMGVERFLAWLLDHHDVRDLQLLLRHNGVQIAP